MPSQFTATWGVQLELPLPRVTTSSLRMLWENLPWWINVIMRGVEHQALEPVPLFFPFGRKPLLKFPSPSSPHSAWRKVLKDPQNLAQRTIWQPPLQPTCPLNLPMNHKGPCQCLSSATCGWTCRSGHFLRHQKDGNSNLNRSIVFFIHWLPGLLQSAILHLNLLFL